MFSLKHSAQLTRSALLFSALLTFGAATTLLSQQATTQAQVPAATVAAPAPAPAAATTPTTPAPAPSVLFAQNETDDHTIAAALAADRQSGEGGSHTIVVSTLVLVLGIIILVLLID